MGMGWMRTLAATDSTAMVINPRTHETILFTNAFPPNITAIACFDVDHDGALDILAGSSNVRSRFNILYGPEYTRLYTWGGYVSNSITNIFTNVFPDTNNIILLSTPYFSIDTDNWDYYISGSYSFYGVGESHIPAIYYHYTYAPGIPTPISATAILSMLSSRMAEINYSELCTESSSPYAITLYGIVKGHFRTPYADNILIPIYCYSMGKRFMLFNNVGSLIDNIPDTSTTQSFSMDLFAYDIDNDEIDDICFFAMSGGVGSFHVYRGPNFSPRGIVSANINSFANYNRGRLYESRSNTIVFKSRYKILVATISTNPVSIENETGPNDANFDLSTYPNPFNEAASIELFTGQPTEILIRAVNLLGQEIDKIYQGPASAGKTTYLWSNQELSSGMYFIVISTPQFTKSRKVVHLK